MAHRLDQDTAEELHLAIDRLALRAEELESWLWLSVETPPADGTVDMDGVQERLDAVRRRYEVLEKVADECGLSMAGHAETRDSCDS